MDRLYNFRHFSHLCSICNVRFPAVFKHDDLCLSHAFSDTLELDSYTEKKSEASYSRVRGDPMSLLMGVLNK